MKKLLITIFGIILLVGIVVSFVQINHSIDLDKKEKDILTSIGINEPIISSCIKIDEFNCKANVFQKGGINKDMEIVIKYCEEYEINYSNGDTYLDLVCHFEDDATNWEAGDAEATLTGSLIDSTSFEGTDTICIAP